MNIDEIINSLIREQIGTSTRKKIYDSIADLMPSPDNLDNKVLKLLELLKNTEKLNNQSSGITDVKALNIAIKKIDILTDTFNKLSTKVFMHEQGNFNNAFFVEAVLMHMKNDPITRKSYENLDIVGLMIKVWDDTLAKTYDNHKNLYPNSSQTLRLLALGIQEFYNELFIGGDKNQRKNKINQFSDLTINIIKKWSDSCTFNGYNSKDFFNKKSSSAIGFFSDIRSLSTDRTIDGLENDFNTMNNIAPDWLAMKLMGQRNGQCSLKNYVENHKNLIESRNLNRTNTPDSLDSGKTDHEDNSSVNSDDPVNEHAKAAPEKLPFQKLMSLFNNQSNKNVPSKSTGRKNS